MANYAYYNGNIQKHESISVSLTDRALYFGDGVYDVMLVRGGIVYQGGNHFERLEKNCRALDISFQMTYRKMIAIIHRLCDLSELNEAVAYVQVSRGARRRIHEIDRGHPENTLITVTPYSGYDDRAVSAITVTDCRHGICNVKTLNLLCSVLALKEAEKNGCECAIFIRENAVTEEARSNVSIIINGRLITHPTDCRILPGIMRSNLLRAARRIGLITEERPFSREEMISAQEIIVSSTTKFIYRVISIDGCAVGGGAPDSYFALRKELIMDFLHETE